ncbi:MAG: 30S ribosomal protein S16 [Deltaproteobacteria bacterium]|nr:30S ribosomal protein S16 [Deltaproteobacteria bacterium]
MRILKRRETVSSSKFLGRIDGKFLEILGTYNPLTDPAEVRIDPERLRVWLDRGAQPSDTVRSLIKQKGLLAGSA